jgi:RND family efflux transporter MFP subunit
MTKPVARLPSAGARARTIAAAIVLAGALVAAGVWALASQAQEGRAAADASRKAAASARPALAVTLVTPQRADWPQAIVANGDVAAWQEAVIGAELSGQRITDVLVNVGDKVGRGQLLAKVAAETVLADLAQARAAVAEAQAGLAEAKVNAERAKQLQTQGFISPQAAVQSATAEETAVARLAAARARAQAEEVRLAHTRVVAPDDGVISSRTATVGSLTQGGQELFRLIRGGRLEWRAEVTASELARVRPGMLATLQPPGSDERIEGRVRMLAPTLDRQTRNAIVYVDLPPGSALRAGMFVRGELQVGQGAALTLPQSAVVLRDGFAYVFSAGGDGRVTEVKVELGRRIGDRVEVTRGVTPEMKLVASGAGFLTDGDTVRIVDAGVPSKPVAATK